MIPSSLQEIFGTVSVGVFATLVLLASIWLYRQPKERFFEWIRQGFKTIEVDASVVALFALALFSFGVVTENATDHLTDSRPRHWIKEPWWPPAVIADVLGSEKHYRFATLYGDCQTTCKREGSRKAIFNEDCHHRQTTCNLGGLGKAIFNDQKTYVQSHIKSQKESALAKDAIGYLTNVDDFEERKETAEDLINRLYYTAKNWAYNQQTYYDELQSIQKHIEFTRSSFVIACWGVILAVIAWAAGFLRWRTRLGKAAKNRSRNLCSPRQQTSRVIRTIGVYTVIAFFAQQGYGHAEINFNERAFGYFTSHLSRQSAAKSFKHPALRANLWMQVSGEYTALCLQTFNQALDRVRQLMTAPPEDDRMPAVILDLDETVINNEKYQGYLLNSKSEYDSASWSYWISDGVDQATLVPGAKHFIDGVQKLDVAVLYISNRPDTPEEREATIETLRRLEIDVTGVRAHEERLLLQGVGKTDSKKLRREAVEKDYRPLILIGDALGDFSSDFDDHPQSGSAIIRGLVKEYRHKWGVSWFVLPNPVYGRWWDLINRKDPLSNLRSWDVGAH